MSAEENKATIRRWVEAAWNNGDFSETAQMYSANYVIHDPAGPIQSPEGLEGFIRAYRQGMPDLHFTVEDMVAEGDKVAWRFTVRGTQTGELMGIAPTGKQAIVAGMVVSRFADGKWVEDWSNYDALGMLQQLGVIPKMG